MDARRKAALKAEAALAELLLLGESIGFLWPGDKNTLDNAMHLCRKLAR